MKITIDRTHWPILTITFPPSSTREEWTEYLDTFAALLDERRTCGAVFDLRIAAIPDSIQRNAIASLLKARDADLRRYVTCIAIVLESAVTRGAVTALNWLFPCPVELRMFSTLTEADAWARSKTPGAGRAAS